MPMQERWQLRLSPTAMCSNSSRSIHALSVRHLIQWLIVLMCIVQKCNARCNNSNYNSNKSSVGMQTGVSSVRLNHIARM